MNKSLVEIFKAVKNPQKFGLVMGKVVADFPNIKIDIGSGVILDKDDLVFSASMLKDYARQYTIDSQDVQISGSQLDSSGTNFSFAGNPLFTDSNGTLGSVPVASIPTVASNWSTDATSFTMDGNSLASTGTITFTDEIVTGDMVMIMTAESNQLFYVMDKVISF